MNQNNEESQDSFSFQNQMERTNNDSFASMSQQMFSQEPVYSNLIHQLIYVSTFNAYLKKKDVYTFDLKRACEEMGHHLMTSNKKIRIPKLGLIVDGLCIILHKKNQVFKVDLIDFNDKFSKSLINNMQKKVSDKNSTIRKYHKSRRNADDEYTVKKYNENGEYYRKQLKFKVDPQFLMKEIVGERDSSQKMQANSNFSRQEIQEIDNIHLFREDENGNFRRRLQGVGRYDLDQLIENDKYQQEEYINIQNNNNSFQQQICFQQLQQNFQNVKLEQGKFQEMNENFNESIQKVQKNANKKNSKKFELDKNIDIQEKNEKQLIQKNDKSDQFICNMTLENTMNGFYDDIFKRDQYLNLNNMKEDSILGYTCDKTIMHMMNYKQDIQKSIMSRLSNLNGTRLTTFNDLSRSSDYMDYSNNIDHLRPEINDNTEQQQSLEANMNILNEQSQNSSLFNSEEKQKLLLNENQLNNYQMPILEEFTRENITDTDQIIIHQQKNKQIQLSETQELLLQDIQQQFLFKQKKQLDFSEIFISKQQTKTKAQNFYDLLFLIRNDQVIVEEDPVLKMSKNKTEILQFSTINITNESSLK